MSTDSDLHLREDCVGSKQVYKGNFLNVLRDEVRLPDGGLASREYVVHPGGSCLYSMMAGWWSSGSSAIRSGGS